MFSTIVIDERIKSLESDREKILSLKEDSPILQKVVALIAYNAPELKEEVQKYFPTATRVDISEDNVSITLKHFGIRIPSSQDKPIAIQYCIPDYDRDPPVREEFTTDIENIALKQIELWNSGKWNIEAFMRNQYNGWHGLSAYTAFLRSLRYIINKGLLKKSYWEDIVRRAKSDEAYKHSLESYKNSIADNRDRREYLNDYILPTIEKMIQESPGWTYERQNAWCSWWRQ